MGESGDATRVNPRRSYTALIQCRTGEDEPIDASGLEDATQRIITLQWELAGVVLRESCHRILILFHMLKHFAPLTLSYYPGGGIHWAAMTSFSTAAYMSDSGCCRRETGWSRQDCAGFHVFCDASMHEWVDQRSA